MDKTFGFLLFDEFEDLDFVGPWEMIGLWNKHFNGPKNITIAENNIITSTKNLRVQCDYNFSNCPKLDYLLVPGGWGTRSEVDNPIIINFIQNQAKQCEHVLSVCTGAFLLQKAGLLKGKKATTHWASIERLKAFNDVTVKQKRYIRDDNIWTSAGISAGMDLALEFIAEIAGYDVAGKVQHHAEYYPEQKIYHSDDLLPEYVYKNA